MPLIGDFRLVAETSERQHATVLVRSWFKKVRRPIYRERWSAYWKFADTGEFLPEGITGAWKAQAELQNCKMGLAILQTSEDNRAIERENA